MVMQYLGPEFRWEGFAESAFPIAPNGCANGDIIHCRQSSTVQPRVDESHGCFILRNESGVNLPHHTCPDWRGRAIQHISSATCSSRVQPLIE